MQLTKETLQVPSPRFLAPFDRRVQGISVCRNSGGIIVRLKSKHEPHLTQGRLDGSGLYECASCLEQVQTEKAVQLQLAAMDAILQTHCISPIFLRTDDFTGFFQNRKATLLNLVEQAMCKQATE